MRGAGGGRRRGRSPDGESLRNTSRRPSDTDDEESVSTMVSETSPQLSHRDPEDMLEVYADGDFEDVEEEEEEEDEEEDALELVVETLTGDCYRVRVSQWDTAASLKDLLYRTQGTDTAATPPLLQCLILTVYYLCIFTHCILTIYSPLQVSTLATSTSSCGTASWWTTRVSSTRR